MENSIKDFNVTIKMRNNQLVERREGLGLSAPKVAEAIGVCYSTYLGYENMSRGPYDPRTSELSESAQKIADFFKVLPDDLWPDAVLAVKKSKAIRRVGSGEMELMIGAHTRRCSLPPNEMVEERLLAGEVRAVLATLTPREELVLRLRFGLEGDGAMTLEEAAKIIPRHASGGEVIGTGVTRENVRRIEANALRKIRHSSRSRHLKSYLPESTWR